MARSEKKRSISWYGDGLEPQLDFKCVLFSALMLCWLRGCIQLMGKYTCVSMSHTFGVSAFLWFVDCGVGEATTFWFNILARGWRRNLKWTCSSNSLLCGKGTSNVIKLQCLDRWSCWDGRTRYNVISNVLNLTPECVALCTLDA